MLTGRQAFAAETVSDTIVRMLDREPDWVALPAHDARRHSPSAAALSREGLRRGACIDMADARLEIEDALCEPRVGPRSLGRARVSTAPASSQVDSGHRGRRRAVAVAAGVRNWRTAPLSTPGRLARLSIPLPATHAFEKGRFPPVALSPDGKLLVYAAAVAEDDDTLSAAAR